MMKRVDEGVENLQLVCNFDLACFLVRHYGLPDVMYDVRYDKNQISSESTNYCRFLTFSFQLLRFLLPGR